MRPHHHVNPVVQEKRGSRKVANAGITTDDFTEIADFEAVRYRGQLLPLLTRGISVAADSPIDPATCNEQHTERSGEDSEV
jgi:hypothetical protein